MPFDRILMRCERAAENNGTVSLTFIKQPDYADAQARQELVQASIKRTRGTFEVGKDYYVEITPA